MAEFSNCVKRERHKSVSEVRNFRKNTRAPAIFGRNCILGRPIRGVPLSA